MDTMKKVLLGTGLALVMGGGAVADPWDHTSPEFNPNPTCEGGSEMKHQNTEEENGFLSCVSTKSD